MYILCMINPLYLQRSTTKFDNLARILNELAPLRRILAIKPKTVLALPQDCPRLPVEDTEQLLLLEEYLKSPENSQKLVSYTCPTLHDFCKFYCTEHTAVVTHVSTPIRSLGRKSPTHSKWPTSSSQTSTSLLKLFYKL